MRLWVAGKWIHVLKETDIEGGIDARAIENCGLDGTEPSLVGASVGGSNWGR